MNAPIIVFVFVFSILNKQLKITIKKLKNKKKFFAYCRTSPTFQVSVALLALYVLAKFQI